MVTAIIVAAGKSKRMGAHVDKAFLSLGPKPVIAYSLMAFEACPAIDRIVLVVRKDQVDAGKSAGRLYGISKLYAVVKGGARRQTSVKCGMEAMDPDTTVIVVHDGARPLVTPDLIGETVRTAQRHGAAVAASKVVDTVKVAAGRYLAVEGTIDRTKLWSAQTPQAFQADILKRAYEKADADKVVFTDDSSAVEALGEPVRLVKCQRPNFKITLPDDLPAANAILQFG
ncbi:MAG: 2-C-methyl-D-erythritol 4-phosphate cytidylyltransferase [Kiritimatiellia bacterium]|jgi:2-C-methyl-D-erythritol 4-phosphate cytidylyltransferase